MANKQVEKEKNKLGKWLNNRNVAESPSKMQEILAPL
jgi:hypothetical protein